MEPFRYHVGVAAPLPLSNIDTDLIIPAQCLRSPDGDLGLGLFLHLRYNADGTENPDFILNRRHFRNSSILVGGDNFGCGSSRVHAVWALQQFGFKCVVATSFGDIFYENAFKNGMLCAIVSSDDRDRLLQICESGDKEVHVDLANSTLRASGSDFPFFVPPIKQQMMLEGLDEIELSLAHLQQIRSFRERDRTLHRWKYDLHSN